MRTDSKGNASASPARMPTSDPLHLVGVTLARRYTVESLVRIEASTVIYRATHVASNRSVAVRVLAGTAALPRARRKALSERLARDHARLTDLAEIIPAAYPLRDVGVARTAQGTLPFVALDWPHGPTLRQMVQPEAGSGASLPESIDDVIAVLEPVAVALAIAHEHGVVHGGLTPDRVLFLESAERGGEVERHPGRGARRATVLDFGVASILKEVASGNEPTAADDVRALASIVAQLLARSSGADARLDEPRSPRARGVPVTDELEAVFVRALGSDTYASVGELWSALRRVLGLATLRSLEVTIPPEPRPLASESLHPLAHPTAPATSQTIREALLYGVGAFALLVVGGLTLQRLVFEGARPARAASQAPCPAGRVAAGGGTARLGAAGDPEDPARDVTLSPFCIDKGSVTTRAYAACATSGACAPPSSTNEWDGIRADDHAVLDAFCTASDPKGDPDRAVNCVSWEMARAFCERGGGRLPTEAEADLASRSTAAGIAEWVSDWRAPIGTAATGATDPSGPRTGEERVVRGPHALGARPTRFGAAPSTRSHAIGFRCVTSP